MVKIDADAYKALTTIQGKTLAKTGLYVSKTALVNAAIRKYLEGLS